MEKGKSAGCLPHVSCREMEVPPDDRRDRRRSRKEVAGEGRGDKDSDGGQAESQGNLATSTMTISGAQKATVWEMIQACHFALSLKTSSSPRPALGEL